MAEPQQVPTHQRFSSIMGRDTMDFLQGLKTSLFGFTESTLRWDPKLLATVKDTQRRFFKEYGHLVTPESALQFPTSYKPGGTWIGINVPWSTRMTGQGGVDPLGQGHDLATTSTKDHDKGTATPLIRITHSLHLSEFSPTRGFSLGDSKVHPRYRHSYHFGDCDCLRNP